MSDGDAGKKVPWWDRLAYTSLRDEKKLREKAERLMSTKDTASCLKDAQWASAWGASLTGALPGILGHPYLCIVLRIPVG